MKYLISIALLLLSLIVNAQNIKVAVFDPVGNVDENVKIIIREELSSAVVKTAQYTVLERQLINKVLEENEFQATGSVDDSQIGELGKKMGANYVCYASLTPIGSNYYVSCKFVEVKTAAVNKQETGRTKSGIDDLLDVIGELSSKMFSDQKPKEVEVALSVMKTEAKKVDNSIPNVDFFGTPIYVLPTDLSDRVSWYQATKACEELNAYGKNNWRLPTKEELNVIRVNAGNNLTFYMKDYWTSSVDTNDEANVLFMSEGKLVLQGFSGQKVKHVENNYYKILEG